MAVEDNASAETKQMFGLVGQAITQWSFVEERLSRIFMVCTSPVIAYPNGGINFGNSSVPTAVFYAVENFRGKLALIDAAMSAHAYGTEDWAVGHRSEWARLREKTRKLSHKRNRLAHWTVLPGHDYEDGTIPARLVPPYGSPGFFAETGSKPFQKSLKVVHLEHLIRAFCLLSDKLTGFAHDLAIQPELFDRYAQQVARQIHSHSQLDPKRAEVLKLALSSQK